MDLAERLRTERNVWLATVRPDGSPHVTPIWFVWHDDSMWLCSSAKSVKARNASANPRVSVALESGNDPAVGEGTVTILVMPYPPGVVDAFKEKFDWDVSDLDDPDGPYDALWQITIDRWLMGGP